ncbi:MAG: hypothetical protein ABSF44_12730 [Candidatus Bathyarchaeia archaeon]
MKTKNLKVFTMILLISALLILASSASLSNVKAATTTALFNYTTLGGSVTANGTALTGGAATNFNSGDTLQFKATASSGFQFLCFVYADASGSITSTDNPFTHTITAACAMEAVFIPTSNAPASTASGGAATVTLFTTIGGTTDPAASTSGASYSNYTIGTASTITQSSGTSGDFKFLCWVTQDSNGASLYTTSSLSLTPRSSGIAIEAIWIPTSSTVTLPSASVTPTPKVDEVSSVMAAIVAAALVAAAVGTVAYTKKARK